MKFPNKIFTYKQSIISKFPKFLYALEKRDYSMLELYKKVEKDIDSPAEFVSILDFLFYLGKIELYMGGVLHYVA